MRQRKKKERANIGVISPLRLVQGLHLLLPMTCRIDRVVIGTGLLILHISGQITGKDVELLRSLLEQEKSVAVIDLKDVLLVDRGAVRLLALSELNGAELRNCPSYIREWVTRERAVINASEQGIEAVDDTEGA